VRDDAPDLLVRLANLAIARRPPHGRRVQPEPFASVRSAAEALGVDRVSEIDLAELGVLHNLIVELSGRLVARRPLGELVEQLMTLAEPSQARVGLEITDEGELRQTFRWSDPTLVSELARRVALELGSLDRARLRRCARPECGLVFYDATRSNTRQWHAESPCGQRERQRRFRAAHGAGRG
jgi:predicted RNA-binding Zn ribbon-like protein